MDAELDALFDRLNADLFDGRLPKYRVRRCTPRNEERGLIEEEARTIWICTTREVRETLLHEMCRIGIVGHRRAFRARLRRLARQGEKWAQAERAYYLRAELGMRSDRLITLWQFATDLKGDLLLGFP
jgi:hypothetical protein